MKELFTLAVILYFASMLVALIFKRNYKLSISLGHAFTALASLSLLAFTINAIPLALQGKAVDIVYNIGVAKIPFHIDGLSLILCFVLGALGLATSVYSPKYMEFYEKLGKGWLYIILYSTFVLSMILIVTVSSLFWFLFLWEVMTFASYVLMIWESEEEYVRKAGWKYFVTMHITSTLPLVIAVALLYAKVGSVDGLNFANLASLKLSPIFYVLFLIGFGSKAGVVPIHFWLPDAHPAAPSNVSALMSGVMIKVAVYGLIRTTCFILKPNVTFGYIVAALGAITLTIGTLYALKQTDAKRLLAYHSVGQMGYIWLGVGVGIIFIAKGGAYAAFGAIALAAGLYHLVNHALFKGLLFLSAGSILYRTHSRDLNTLGGLAKLMPFTAIFTFIAAMSIAGTPPFNGFMSKWMIYQSTFLSNNGLIVFFGVMALFISAATLASFIKFYTTAFGGEPTELTKDVKEVSSQMLIAKGFLASLCLVLGLVPALILPLLLSPGSDLTGVELANWITTKYWLVMIKAPSMPIGAESYFKPLLFMALFSVIFIGMYLLFPISRKMDEPWTLGEPVAMSQYKYKAVNYYEPFEEYIHFLYHAGHVLSEFGGRVNKAVARLYVGFSEALHSCANAVSRAVTLLGHSYVKNTSEIYFDEYFVAPLVKISRVSGILLDEGFARVNGALTLALVILAVILALMVL
ncbi:proton-conducting transporter transmembrane domain-containing protein [Thermococcus paralvinellae]|uniref:Hydrogenase 4, component B or formate hydrogen lyase subunit 3 n=1 Tax=Thermococcus paralvinellae TaxID=582419 RepID=W0I8S1_9EURY|nr:proton-conducting transporter membrane subunit [Thermococcus paralvinellae]AHF80870.1 Hydrogenase 4, component B or formate hydrogen lyase subunit 3 [Thermococcus paralvinellae]